MSQFLGVIASLLSPLLHGEMIALLDIYRILRSYYQFAPSESRFIQFAYINREIIDGKLEHPLHLYLKNSAFCERQLII